MSPEVSVVVPTHNRPAGLARLIDALERQTLTRDRFDVVVVDDGSDPPADGGERALDLRVVRHDQPRGAAAARNAGWRASDAPLIAFIDDDCEPSPAWLEAILEAAAGNGSVVVQGPVAPPEEERSSITPVSHTIEINGPDRLFATCNIAYSRAVLARTGGFDEWFRRAGEDVEFGARARKVGAEPRWADGALVYHEVRHLGVAGMLRHTTKWTEAVRTVALHPELRELLTARVFWKPTHPLLLLAALGLATRRPLVTAVAAAPYVRHYWRVHDGRPTALARWLPTHAAIDACEIGTAAIGSIQHRTLML